MPQFDGLSNHIMMTSDVHYSRKKDKAWPWALLLGCIVGFAVGCSL